MLQSNQRITVAIPGHWLMGTLSLAGNRIQEALNDSRTDFLELREVDVQSHGKRNSTVRLPDVIVPKSQVQIVAVPTSQHEAPVKRWNNLTAKQAFRTFAIAQDYRVWGDLHLPNKPNRLQFTLTQQLSQFFALTNARYILGDQQVHVPLLLVNKEFVSCLHVGETAHAEGLDAEQLSCSGS